MKRKTRKRYSDTQVLLFSLTACLDLLFLAGTLAIEPASSCRDHFLSGQHESAILPLAYDTSRSTFRVKCEFPTYSSQSHLSVVTVVHNGLEQWYSLNHTEKNTLTYQIRDWYFLRSIVLESFCQQNLLIDWGDAIESGSESENVPEFIVETLHGVQRTFRRDISINESQSSNKGIELISLEGYHQAPIVHLIPKRATSRITVRATALVCQRAVVARAECLFELVTGGESLWIDTKSAAYADPAAGSASTGARTLSFSFRTAHPNAPFFSVRTLAGESIRVNLIDGYLLSVNHIIHPIGLLADGNWHRVTLDLDMFTVRVDRGGTSISLRSSSPDGSKIMTDSISEVNVLLITAQVTGIVVGPTRPQTLQLDQNILDSHWLCNSKFVRLRKAANSARNAHLASDESVARVFGFGREICSADEFTESYCNCRAPNSVLLPPQQTAPQAQTCPIQDGSKALRLIRYSDRLTFIYLPTFPRQLSLSLVFKSELEDGLLLFGVSSSSVSSDTNNELVAQATRVQVHFAGTSIVAVVCNQPSSDGAERCYSCSIHRPQGFLTRDWLRVSLFNYELYYFMALNGKICHLSPNSAASDASELYKISGSISNALFIGGMYYAKHFQLNRRLNDTLRRQMQDNTREKPFSFQGCIAELRVEGVTQNLGELLDRQKATFAKTPDDVESIFAVHNDGTCAHVDDACAMTCGDAPCRSRRADWANRTRTTPPTEWLQPDYDNGGRYDDEIPYQNFECNCAAVYRKRGAVAGCRRSDHEVFENLLPISGISNENSAAQLDALKNTVPTSVIRLSAANPTVISIPWSDNSYRSASMALSHNYILSKIWLFLRFPTVSSDEQTIIQIGAIEVRVANNGRTVTVHIGEYDIHEEFRIDNSADNRLHLLAVELNAAPRSATHRKSLSVRVDADSRTPHHGIERIPFFPQSDPVQVAPVRSEEDSELNARDAGCIAEFVMSYETPREETWIHRENFKIEEDFLQKLIRSAEKSLAEDRLQNPRILSPIGAGPCGIHDPTLWLANSSAWGAVGEFDPSGVNGGYSNPIISFASVIITFVLIVLLLLLIYCYCYTRFAKEKDRISGHYYKSNIVGKTTHFRKCDKLLNEEKRPLNSESSLLNSSRNSSSPRSPPDGIDIFDAHYPAHNDIHGHTMQIITPVQTSNYVIVHDDPRASPFNGFVVDEYSSSPKLAARRQRSKAAILLRRPPDPPPRTVINITASPRADNTSEEHSSQPSSTLTRAATSSLARTNGSRPGLAAPIASQEQEDL